MLVALITFVAISNCINHLVRFSGEHIGSINRSINCRLSVNQHCFAVSHFGFTYTHSCMFFQLQLRVNKAFTDSRAWQKTVWAKPAWQVEFKVLCLFLEQPLTLKKTEPRCVIFLRNCLQYYIFFPVSFIDGIPKSKSLQSSLSNHVIDSHTPGISNRYSGKVSFTLWAKSEKFETNSGYFF